MDVAWAVLGGALAGGIVSLVIEELRWRRNQRVRWHDTRRETYAHFLGEVHSVFSWWIMSESGRRLLANLREYRQLEDRILSAIAPLNIIAGQKVKSAADNLLEAVNAAVDEGASRLAQGGLYRRSPISAPERDRLTEVFIQRRGAFEEAVRDELGLA